MFVLLLIGSMEPILQDILSLIPARPILQNELGPIPNPTSLCQRSVHKYLDTYILTRKRPLQCLGMMYTNKMWENQCPIFFHSWSVQVLTYLMKLIVISFRGSLTLRKDRPSYLAQGYQNPSFIGGLGFYASRPRNLASMANSVLAEPFQ